MTGQGTPVERSLNAGGVAASAHIRPGADACATVVRCGPTGSSTVLLAEASGIPGVRVGHACPACGSSAHGVPYLVLPDGSRPRGVWISISHAEGLDVVAVSYGGPVGVDAERSDSVTDRAVALIRHPLEPDADPDVLWVRKEAVLKALGTGLRADASAVRIGVRDGRPCVVSGPGAGTTHLADLDLPDGYTGAVCVSPVASATPAVPDDRASQRTVR